MRDLENFIHPETLTTELAVVDNIAHELKRLNHTMSFISETLMCIGKYLEEKQNA